MDISEKTAKIDLTIQEKVEAILEKEVAVQEKERVSRDKERLAREIESLSRIIHGKDAEIKRLQVYILCLDACTSMCTVLFTNASNL